MFTRTKNLKAAKYMRSQIESWINQAMLYKRQISEVKGEKKRAFFDEMVHLKAQIHQMQDQLNKAEG